MCVKQVSLIKCEIICSPGLRHILFVVKYFLCVITRCYVNHSVSSASTCVLHVFSYTEFQTVHLSP